MSAAADLLNDGLVVTRRNMTKFLRVPEIVAFGIVQPIMFVLLFAYIYGSAISLEGTSYREFLIAGIFAQTVVFGSVFTGMGMAEDMKKGVIDRFRSLPMSSASVLVGRTVADLALSTLSMLVMALAGLVVGWRVRSSVLEALGGILLLLFFAYCLSWLMCWVGLVVPSPEAVQNATFLFMFPLTFVANTFVPLENLPTAFRVFAEWNPVSSVTQGARELFGNGAGVARVSDAWPIQHPVAYTFVWGLAALAVFVPLSVRAYQRAAAK